MLTRAPRRRRLPPGRAGLRRRLAPLTAPGSPGPYYAYCPLRPGTASDARGTRVTRGGSSRRELRPLRPDPVQQLLEGVGELLHALRLERLDDVVVVDARLGELLEQPPRLVEALRERLPADLAVVLEGLDRLERHRVHRLGADQLLDVEHVAV